MIKARKSTILRKLVTQMKQSKILNLFMNIKKTPKEEKFCLRFVEKERIKNQTKLNLMNKIKQSVLNYDLKSGGLSTN